MAISSGRQKFTGRESTNRLDTYTLSIPEAFLLNYNELLKGDNLEEVALSLTENLLEQEDFLKKDVLDRFLDHIYFLVLTGDYDIPSLAYPTKRMSDRVMEKKVIELINIHLYPEILFRILKFFTRNLHEADTNLYIANLIFSEDVIRSLYETFLLFREDIFIADPGRRTLNVKRIQQYSARAENKMSSPLDAAARLKYVLEFLLITRSVGLIYRKEDITLARPDADQGRPRWVHP